MLQCYIHISQPYHIFMCANDNVISHLYQYRPEGVHSHATRVSFECDAISSFFFCLSYGLYIYRFQRATMYDYGVYAKPL